LIFIICGGIDWETYNDKILAKDGPLEAVFNAKEEGLIRHISFSFHDAPENLSKIIDHGFFETMLVQYNLLDRANESGISYGHDKGLGVVIMGPLAGGRLGQPSETIRALVLGKLYSSPEIALRFVLSNPNVSCVLSGMNSIEQVEENARIASNTDPLSEEELKKIASSMNENKRLSDLYCTGCNYCMPCPFGVNIPLNFQIMNYHRVYKITDYARDLYSQIGKQPWLEGLSAASCTGCGSCEEKCPQRIEIRKQLKETNVTLGPEF
jgi:predicted aldo/keto reductase-like oxidoreductase